MGTEFDLKLKGIELTVRVSRCAAAAVIAAAVPIAGLVVWMIVRGQ